MIATPADVLLLVEVADSSLAYDRTVKAGLYAERGLREYWIAAVQAKTVHAYTNPSAERYAQTHAYRRGESIRSAAFPEQPFPVDRIFS